MRKPSEIQKEITRLEEKFDTMCEDGSWTRRRHNLVFNKIKRLQGEIGMIELVWEKMCETQLTSEQVGECEINAADTLMENDYHPEDYVFWCIVTAQMEYDAKTEI